MPIDIAHLFSGTYLFNTLPGPFLPWAFKVIATIFAASIVLGLVFKKLAEKSSYAPARKFFSKMDHFLVTMGTLGLIYTFFRQQSIYILSMPLWLLLLLVGSLVWAGFIAKYYFTDKPVREEEIKKEAEKKKYL